MALRVLVFTPLKIPQALVVSRPRLPCARVDVAELTSYLFVGKRGHGLISSYPGSVRADHASAKGGFTISASMRDSPTCTVSPGATSRLTSARAIGPWAGETQDEPIVPTSRPPKTI